MASSSSTRIITMPEKAQTFLLKLSDALRPLDNPVEIEEVATKIAMDLMDADRCHYCTIEEENFIILRDAFRGDFPSVVGVYPMSSFALYKAVINTGRPFIVDDVHTSNILDEDLKEMCLQFQYRSFINVPVIKNGKAVGLFCLVQSKPRNWTETEVQLTIETAERTWAAVERAKVEEALRKSEEKYRSLFNSIDEGFSILEVLFDDKAKAVDYTFLEMNDAHREMTGVSQTAIGMRISELMPDLEESVLERFGKVVLTGEPVRYEQYVSAWNRWFDVYSYRVGGDGSCIVANVFNNITDRKQVEEKLKESERRFRAMADSAPVLIWTIDADGLSSYYNKSFLDFVGVSKDEDISDWRKIVHPDDVEFTFDTINTAIAERRSYSLELRLLRADGQWRWVMAQGNPSLGTDNEFLGFVGSSVDITERKQAEAKIAESENRYHNMIYSSPSLIAIFKGEDMIIDIANDAILESWGKGKDIIGKSLISVMPEIVEQGFEEMLLSVYKTGAPVHAIEMPVTLIKSGKPELMHYTFVYQAQYNAGGEIEGVAIIANEVTRQVELNHKIKENEQYFRQLTDTVPAIIWIAEPDGNCSYLNKNWYSYTGQTEEEAKGFGWLNATHPDDKEETGRIFLEANAKHKPFIASYRLKVKNGDYRWAIDRGSPKFSEDGVYQGMIGTVVDVHEEKLAEERLTYRTALLEAHNQASVDGILLVDARGKIISYNQRFIEIWNMPQNIVEAKDDEAALAFAMSQLVHPQQFIDKVKYLYDNPTETSLDELEYKDGRIVERNGYPVIGNDGSYYAWSWTFKDITERKKIEQDLINTKEQLELTFKNIPAGVYLINQKGEMIYVNERGALIYGDFLPQDLLEIKDLQPLLKIADELFERFDEDGKIFAAENSPAFISLTTGQASQAVMLQINKVTKVRSWFYIQGAPLLTADGKVSMVLVTSTDITVQKTSEKAVRESEDRFRTMAETLPQMIWVRNMDGSIEYASKSWETYTGIKDTSEAWRIMTHPDDWERIMGVWQNALDTGNSFHYEGRMKNKEGEYRWHYAVGEPVRDEEGQVVKFIGALTDIHVQKTFSEKLETLVAERTKALQRSNEDLQQFAHVASHDLKEPVRKIRTFGSRLTQEFGTDLPEKAKNYLTKMESAASRLSTMIDGVLVYSSIGSEAVPNQIIDLNETIRQIEEDLELLIAQKNATIRYRDLPSLEGSPILIYQLFYNLINNSLKFAKSDIPSIIDIATKTVSTKNLLKYDLEGTAENYVGIMVKDNGIGFDLLEAEKIFKTFSRLHSKDLYEGTGLGLALSKKIVERHGGAISAEGQRAEGATFKIILPVITR